MEPGGDEREAPCVGALGGAAQQGSRRVQRNGPPLLVVPDRHGPSQTQERDAVDQVVSLVLGGVGVHRGLDEVDHPELQPLESVVVQLRPHLPDVVQACWQVGLSGEDSGLDDGEAVRELVRGLERVPAELGLDPPDVVQVELVAKADQGVVPDVELSAVQLLDHGGDSDRVQRVVGNHGPSLQVPERHRQVGDRLVADVVVGRLGYWIGRDPHQGLDGLDSPSRPVPGMFRLGSGYDWKTLKECWWLWWLRVEDEPELDPGPDPELELEAGPEPDPDPGPDPELETGPEPDPDPDPETGPEPDPEPDPDPELETGPELELEPEPETGPEPEPEPCC
ncbi:hypothetical protein OJ252_508 [Cryptosporidium canis]|uniref:Uncharacterized protein n=1 Tax=Cryptosporidium canis TaxID=195482 RepID=A0ABQ8PAQ2_9CRYT|nr:hypothetical protein OJ252_508 [Cryptosporidium canis]